MIFVIGSLCQLTKCIEVPTSLYTSTIGINLKKIQIYLFIVRLCIVKKFKQSCTMENKCNLYSGTQCIYNPWAKENFSSIIILIVFRYSLKHTQNIYYTCKDTLS